MQPAMFKAGNYPYDIEAEIAEIDTVSTLPELDDLIETLDALDERLIEISVDTETVDIDPKKEAPAGKGRVVTAQVSWIEEADEMSLEELVEAIQNKEVEPTRVWIDCRDPKMLVRFKGWLEKKNSRKILHGASFDKHVLWNSGIIMEGIVGNTLQMSRDQYPERMSHSLDGEVGLVRKLLGDKRLTTKQALGVYKKKKNGEDGKSVEFVDMLTYVNDDEMRPFQQVYSTFDVYDTIRLYYILRLWMKQMEWEGQEGGFYQYWEEHGLPLMEVLIRIERQGVCIDEGVVDELMGAYIEIETGLKEKIYAILGAPVNLNSSQQKAWVLYGSGEKEFSRPKKEGGPFMVDGLELPCKEVTEGGTDPWKAKKNKAGRWSDGNPSTDKEHLEWTLGFIEPDSDEAELLRLLRDLSEIHKLISGTLEPLKRNLRPRHKTGIRTPGDYLYVHSNLSPVARTGRLACSLPNLQQIPSRTYLGKRIRHAFTCEEGQAFIVADYDQLELNILSWYLAKLFDDTSYAQILRSGDIHQTTADALGISRPGAKTVNFGIIYGMTEYLLAITLKVPVSVARNILRAYYEEYPYVLQYTEWAISYAKEHGTARTMLGRYRQLPNINDTFRGGRRQGKPTGAARSDERRAGNTPIQGSAQDVCGTAMIAIDKDEELKDYHYNMNIQCHDEICGTCDSQYREKALARKIHLMENAITFPEYEGVVQFPVSGSTGLTWGEGKCDGSFSCKWCKGRGRVDGKKCPTCKGEGEFNVQRAGDIWVAEAVS